MLQYKSAESFINFGYLIYLMKIMKVFDKKVSDTTYYKYRINLPKKVVEKSNFLNKELKAELYNNKIIIYTE